jgi:hypothetical protein
MYKNLSDYISKKSIQLTTVRMSLDFYRENLTTSLSGLVMKSDDKSRDALRRTIDCEKIKNALEEADYPFIESFMICLEQGNSKKILNHIQKIEDWIFENSLDESIVNLIESEFWLYQSNILKKEIEPEDVDYAIESLTDKSTFVLEEMVLKIENELSKIEWDNHPIMIKALPSDKWIAEKARVEIGNQFVSSFDLLKETNGFVIENIVLSEMPERMKNQIQALMQRLKESPKIKQLVTLYMSKPVVNRDLFENKRKQIALGIKTFLPKGTILTNVPIDENQDIWKVKIEKINLLKSLQEGDVSGFKIIGESNLRWIELFRRQNEK